MPYLKEEPFTYMREVDMSMEVWKIRGRNFRIYKIGDSRYVFNSGPKSPCEWSFDSKDDPQGLLFFRDGSVHKFKTKKKPGNTIYGKRWGSDEDTGYVSDPDTAQLWIKDYYTRKGI